MRPVDKGTAPAAAYVAYGDAASDLVGRLGRYCSYCERRIETHLAVEHVQPKTLVLALMLSWSNFLLACVNCNSCKGSAAVVLADYFWPDSDNTLRAFEYTQGGLLRTHPALPPPLDTKAKASISLTGLDLYPGSPAGSPTTADLRWQRRQEVWTLAQKCVAKLAANNTVEVRELIAELAAAHGLFSIWWTVFALDFDMRRRLRASFRGTDPTSFDPLENAVQRAGGQV